MNATFDLAHLQEIHRRLYQDVWTWAGQPRTVEISKGGNEFHAHAYIQRGFATTHEWLVGDTDLLNNPQIDEADFVMLAADLMEKVNYIHPFRDGIGRGLTTTHRPAAQLVSTLAIRRDQ